MLARRTIGLALVFLAAGGCGRGVGVTPFPAGVVDQRLSGDMALSPDGRTLAVADVDGALVLCDLTTGKAEDVPSPFPQKKETGVDWYNHVVYSRHGRLLAVAYEGRAIVVREIPSAKETVRIPLEGDGVNAMAFVDDDRTLLGMLMTTAKDAPAEPWGDRPLKYMAVRWDASSGERLSIADFGTQVRFEALSPDGRYAVLAVDTKPGVPFRRGYHVFDLSTGAKLFQVGGTDVDPDWVDLAGSWVFSSDGSTLVWTNQKGISIRDVPSGKERKHFHTRPMGSTDGATLSSDGRLLAVRSGRTVSLFSTETGKLLNEVECHDSADCRAVRLSPDGRILATQSASINGKDQPVAPLLKLWKITGSW